MSVGVKNIIMVFITVKDSNFNNICIDKVTAYPGINSNAINLYRTSIKRSTSE